MQPSCGQIRDARPPDATEICRIYNPYILKTDITFEEETVTASTMRDRMAQVQDGKLPWLVWHSPEIDAIQGYAYASPWKSRSAYRFTVETSIYVDEAWQCKGIGQALYESLLHRLREQGFHSAIGILTLPNPKSVALHERFGFRQVGHLPEAGFKFNRWIDVGYWQRRL